MYFPKTGSSEAFFTTALISSYVAYKYKNTQILFRVIKKKRSEL
jgi:hypothetical protein